MSLSELRTVRAVCPHDCPDTCGMVVTVEDGRAVEPARRHGSSRSRAASSARRSRATSIASTTPSVCNTHCSASARRGRDSSSASRWDEAIATIAGASRRSPRPRTARRRFCRTATPARWATSRFAASTGGSSIGSAHRCWTAPSAPRQGRPAATSRSARAPCIDPEAVVHSRYIINWGSNTSVTNMHLWALMHQARKAGARIVTIDPYRSKTAAAATGGFRSAPAPTPPWPWA